LNYIFSKSRLKGFIVFQSLQDTLRVRITHKISFYFIFIIKIILSKLIILTKSKWTIFVTSYILWLVGYLIKESLSQILYKNNNVLFRL